MKRIIPFFTSLVFIFLFTSTNTQASHIMGGNLTYQCVGGSTYTFELTLYRDCNGINLAPTSTISVSSPTCGSHTVTLPLASSNVVTPICPTEPDACLGQPNANLGVEENIYTGTFTLPTSGCSDWTASWSSCCRNGAITNLVGASSNSMYIASQLDDSGAMCNNSPQFFNDPIFYGCVNQPISYSHGVYDADNDSLVFSLASPLTAANNTVTYNPGLSSLTPFTTVGGVSIDPQTGVITFTPSVIQVSVLTVLVEEYRNGVKIGEVMRDIQMAIFNCSNNLPQLSGINGTVSATGSTGSKSISTCVGSQVCFTIDSYDQDAPTQTLSLSMSNNLAGATLSVGTGATPTATICWTPTAADLGTNLFSVQVEDDNCPTVGEAIFTYSINVTSGNGNVGISTQDTTISIGDSIQLMTYGLDTSCSIIWSPAAGLSCTTCPNPVATPATGTVYTAVIDCGGCTKVDSVFIDAITPFNIVQGAVSSGSGNILGSVGIVLRDSTHAVIDFTNTDAQGNYSFQTYETKGYLQASPANFPNELMTYAQNAVVVQDATLLNLTGTNTYNITTFGNKDLQGTGSLGGILKDDMGNTLNNVRVVLMDAQNQPIAEHTTNNTGYISFNNLIAGTYNFWVDQLGIDNGIAPQGILHATFLNKDSLQFTLYSNRLEVVDLTNTKALAAFSSLELFPNPASDHVYLKYELKTSTELSIRIFDVTGKALNTVLNETQSAGNYQLNLQPYLKGQSGVYWIKIKTDSGVVTRKLIYTK